jgi:hypothetical protein
MSYWLEGGYAHPDPLVDQQDAEADAELCGYREPRWPAGYCQDCNSYYAPYRVLRSGHLIGPCCMDRTYFETGPSETDLERSGQLMLAPDIYHDEEAA